jgi:hypothetical protein
MAVINQWDAFELRYQEIGKKRIQVVGEQQVGLMKQQEEEKPQVESGVKKRALLEKQLHANASIGSTIHGRAFY